jgi:hypothetical protein
MVGNLIPRTEPATMYRIAHTSWEDAKSWVFGSLILFRHSHRNIYANFAYFERHCEKEVRRRESEKIFQRF